MTSAVQISQYIYNKKYGGGNPLLNRLLYMCFGLYGAVYKEYLFCDKIEAWTYGPVIEEVHTLYDKDFFKENHPYSLSPRVERIADTAISTYMSSKMILDEIVGQNLNPYNKHYQRGVAHIEIPKDEIIAYYEKYLKVINDVNKVINDEMYRNAVILLSEL